MAPAWKSIPEVLKKKKLNNEEGGKLLKATSDQVQVFGKSLPKKNKLIKIQEDRIAKQLHPFQDNFSTSLRRKVPNSSKAKKDTFVLHISRCYSLERTIGALDATLCSPFSMYLQVLLYGDRKRS